MCMKCCAVCRESKPLDQFHKDKTGKYGRTGRCKLCVNSHNKLKRSGPTWRKKNREVCYRRLLKRVYGLSEEEYADLLRKQDGVCAICKKPDNDRTLSVDHDHKTNKVRGLLCKSCNRGIGFLQDDVKILAKAIEYLNEHT